MTRRLSLLAGLQLAGLWSPLVSTGHAAQNRRPAVVFIAQRFGYLEEYEAAGDLRAAGFEVGALFWQDVTSGSLKPFNVVVLTDIPGVDEQGRVSAQTSKACDAVDAFCRAGGGVLACMGAGGWDRGRVAANLLLKRWDAELLDEQVTDPAHLFVQTRGIRWSYSWTTAVTPSPVTTGIRTIFYPAKPWRADGQKTLYAPRFGPQWQVLVRGEPSARSVRSVPRSTESEKQPATYANSPPIAGVREVGGGRAAVFALWPNWTFWGAHRECMEGIVWDMGAEGRASDTGKFCIQLLRWLAEPSLRGGALGGYVTPERPPTRPLEYPPRPVDWAKLDFDPPSPLKHWRVLAGARTSYSVGQGSVAEYARAAAAAGFHAILFAERLEDLTAVEWNALRKNCAAASSRDFLALPGIDFRTLQGDEYVAFGEFNYPRPPGLAADGKHVDDTYNLWGSQMHSGFLAITRLHVHPQRDPQMLKNMTACAVATYAEGRLVDDSLDHYLALDGQFHNLVPLSLHLVSSPSEVQAAAKTGLQNVWRVRDAEDLREQITPHRQAGLLYWLNPHRSYLTSGPRLTDWQGLNVMSWGPPAPGADRWKIRAIVEAEAGVEQVQVLDRARPHLRVTGEGKRCQLDFPGFHDRQHVFHVVATDRRGGRLVSPGIRIRFSKAYVNQCGDHQNTISACLQRNARGRQVYTSGTTRGVYAGWIPTWSAPCPVDATLAFPPFWDGVNTGVAGKAGVRIFLAGEQEEGGENAAAANLYELASPEVQILDQVVGAKYPPQTPPRRDCAPTYRTVPTDFIEYTVHRLTPTARFQRAGLSINEVRVRALRDFQFDEQRDVPLVAYAFSDYGSRAPGIGDHVFVRFADGRTYCRVGPPGAKQWTARGNMEPGDYVAAYPNPLGAGALFPLTPVRVHIVLTGKLFAAQFGLPVRGRQARKGQTWTLRFLAAAAATELEQGNQVFEDIRRTLGIGCEPAYTAQIARGREKPLAGALGLEAERYAAIARLSRTVMPTDLLVQVSGLNDHWTAAMQLDGGPLRPLGVSRGEAYTNIDLNPKALTLTVGHPVTSDQPSVRLVAWWAEEGLQVFANNPTADDMVCTLRVNDAFKGLPVGQRRVAIGAGKVATVSWSR